MIGIPKRDHSEENVRFQYGRHKDGEYLPVFQLRLDGSSAPNLKETQIPGSQKGIERAPRDPYCRDSKEGLKGP